MSAADQFDFLKGSGPYIQEIETLFGLGDEESGNLWRQISGLVMALRVLMDWQKKLKKAGSSRKSGLQSLRRIKTHLDGLDDALVNADPQTGLIIPAIYGGDENAHPSALAVLLGKPVPTRFFTHPSGEAIGDYQDSSGVRLWPGLQALFGIGQEPEEGLLPLLLLLDFLKKPLDRLLELEKHYKGGTPRNQYRNAFLWELSFLFEKYMGEPATATPSGRFILFCDLVFNAVGGNTRGLEKAAERILRSRREFAPDAP
jgi:hypothetical protein